MLLFVDKHTDLEIENVLTVGLTTDAQTPDSVVAFTAMCSENVRKAFFGCHPLEKPTEKYVCLWAVRHDMHNYSPHRTKTIQTANAVQVRFSNGYLLT